MASMLAAQQVSPFKPPMATISHKVRANRIVTSANAREDKVVSGASGPVSRELPNSQGVMLDPTASRHSALVYGTDFVLCRQRSGGPGLVRRPGTGVQPYKAAAPSGNMGLALHAMQKQTGLVPVGGGFSIADGGSVVIDTFAMPVEDHSAASSCLGMVLVDSPHQEEEGMGEGVVETHSSNPRRTERVRFTCNLCGGQTISPVNPHAFHHGSVFARCGHCAVTHKLKDNLKLFMEVKGPIFRSARRAAGWPIPRNLPQQPDLGGAKAGGVDILRFRKDKDTC